MEMIEQSDLIIAGTAEELVSGDSKRVTIKIDKVLKGQYSDKELTLEITRSRYGWTEFPSVSKVMVLLTKEEDNSYRLTTDLNNVAMITKDGEIEIIANRGGTGTWPLESYERFYTLFFEENNKPDNQPPQNPPQNLPQKPDTPNNNFAIWGLIVIFVFLRVLSVLCALCVFFWDRIDWSKKLKSPRHEALNIEDLYSIPCLPSVSRFRRFCDT